MICGVFADVPETRCHAGEQPLSGAQIVRVLASAMVCGSIVARSHPSSANNMQFSGKDVVLERAIAADDAGCR
jgi:hypothetical protein